MSIQFEFFTQDLTKTLQNFIWLYKVFNYPPYLYLVSHREKRDEPQHDKTNKVTAHSEDLDWPGHPPSRISLRCALNG